MAKGYKLYRGATSRDNIDWTTPIATVGAVVTADVVQSDLIADTVYYFAIRAHNDSDIEGLETDVFVKITTDENGEYVLRPNPPGGLGVLVGPGGLMAEVGSGGKITLSWTHTHQNEAVAVSVFAIYYDNGTGVIDYTTALATTALREYTTGVLSDGPYLFVVRSRSAAGIEDKNTTQVAATADGTAPGAISDISVGVVFG